MVTVSYFDIEPAIKGSCAGLAACSNTQGPASLEDCAASTDKLDCPLSFHQFIHLVQSLLTLFRPDMFFPYEAVTRQHLNFEVDWS